VADAVVPADLKTIVFHPTWGVPDGIKTKELAPILRKSSGGFFGFFGGGYSAASVLEAYQLRAYVNGRPVDANSVDWNSIDIRSVSFQQPPGPKNPLGDVKFVFPNKHDVYMHDTPERDLFVRSFRALSHGCMRVEHPRRFAAVLLAEDKGWPEAKVGTLFNGDTQEVGLSAHIPVHVTYFTAIVDYQGNLRTFRDLYGLDARVGDALLGRKVRFETPRYDDEPVARAQMPQQSSGPSTLAQAISDLFSP
jgi:L,D-transpeptidase YcbB